MYRKPLSMRVWDGVLRMEKGETTTVGKIATIEGVSKSPQLYRVLDELVEAGFLTRVEAEHTNGHKMFVFVRTYKPDKRNQIALESEGV